MLLFTFYLLSLVYITHQFARRKFNQTYGPVYKKQKNYIFKIIKITLSKNGPEMKVINHFSTTFPVAENEACFLIC